MPKYQVHVYPAVRVLVTDIEAETPEAAMKQAEELVDLHRLFDGLGGPHVVSLEYADDIDGFLVDVDGDPEHKLSAWYDGERRRQ
jgi:hypothetical protein